MRVAEKSGQLETPQAEVEDYLHKTHTDREREEDLQDTLITEDVADPSAAFSLSEPSWTEVKEVVRKARAASAPGPNGIQYKVYCTSTAH